MSKEMIDHPDHYNSGKYEVIDVIEDWDLGFHLGNAIKYIARAEYKGNPKEDLKKARWYLDRHIDVYEEDEEKSHPKGEVVEKKYIVGKVEEDMESVVTGYQDGETLYAVKPRKDYEYTEGDKFNI